MSRTNPYKKKRCAAKVTMLIYGEGLAEEIFLKHLRKLYGQNSGKAVTIKRGKGGAPEDIVSSAINYPGSYQEKIVVFDNDKTKKEMGLARIKAQKNNIRIIENTPCLESLLLGILEKDENFVNQASNKCKDLFEKKYINKKQRNESHRYEKLFTKKLLDERRSFLPILKQLISLIER